MAAAPPTGDIEAGLIAVQAVQNAQKSNGCCASAKRFAPDVALGSSTVIGLVVALIGAVGAPGITLGTGAALVLKASGGFTAGSSAITWIWWRVYECKSHAEELELIKQRLAEDKVRLQEDAATKQILQSTQAELAQSKAEVNRLTALVTKFEGDLKSLHGIATKFDQENAALVRNIEEERKVDGENQQSAKDIAELVVDLQKKFSTWMPVFESIFKTTPDLARLRDRLDSVYDQFLKLTQSSGEDRAAFLVKEKAWEEERKALMQQEAALLAQLTKTASALGLDGEKIGSLIKTASDVMQQFKKKQ